MTFPFSVLLSLLVLQTLRCNASHHSHSHDADDEVMSKKDTYIANQAPAALDEHSHSSHDVHHSKELASDSGDYLGSGPEDDAIHGSFVCNGLQDLSIEVYVAHGQVEITMTGPQGEWFAFGFGSFRMEGTYAIIAGEDCVADYILSKGTVGGDQADRKIADSPLTVLSDDTDGFFRTIKLQRPRDHPETFSFPSNVGDLPIISAKAAYREHRVAYHGNNRSPFRMQMQRIGGSGGSGGGGDYGNYTPQPTRRPTDRPTLPPPTKKPTARPTYKPTARPTLRPTAKPTPRTPTKPPTTLWPTAKPTHASCCIPKPEQGQDGYQHAARHHDHPMTCDDASYSRTICEKLLNAQGSFRCDWHQGPECYAQEAAALEQNKLEAAQWEKETTRRLELEEAERRAFEEAERKRVEQEALEVAAWLKEKEEGERKMAQIVEERRIEDEQWEEAVRKEAEERERTEAERKKREEMEAEDEWDGPSGECVWSGEGDLKHSNDAAVFDNQCQVLAEADCVKGGPYGRCQWVGFSHMHFPERPEVEMEEEKGLSVDVRAILNMKVSTLDLVLGVAFVLTASFAMHQLYRWCSERREYKRMSSANEAAPLLAPVKV